jgi:hypothetical protein
LFFGNEPFGRDLAYLATLVGEGRLDPQLAGALPWEEIEGAMQRLQNRDVAGKFALTLGG